MVHSCFVCCEAERAVAARLSLDPRGPRVHLFLSLDELQLQDDQSSSAWQGKAVCVIFCVYSCVLVCCDATTFLLRVDSKIPCTIWEDFDCSNKPAVSEHADAGSFA